MPAIIGCCWPKEGRIFPVEVTANHLEYNGKEYNCAFVRDISQRKRVEQMRHDFVDNVSHEFKTPLTAIQGFAEILLDGGLEDTQNSRRFLEFIHEYAVDLARLTDDLLDLSLIETGKLQMNLAPVRVAELIRSCANLLRFQANAKQINLQVDCAPDLPPVRGDTQRLGQVVKNLLNNAVRYTPPGGSVTVHSALADGQVMIAISDTGIGIPRAEQERISERFYRVDPGRAREGGGTGLGLSIVKHLVEAQGGRITVDSEVGRGATFSVFLPPT